MTQVSPYSIPTNGIGNKSTYHINTKTTVNLTAIQPWFKK